MTKVLPPGYASRVNHSPCNLAGKRERWANSYIHTSNELTENCETSFFIIHTDLAPRLSQRDKEFELRGFRNCYASATVDYPQHGVDPLAFSCFLVDGAASPPICETKENKGQVTFSVQCKVSPSTTSHGLSFRLREPQIAVKQNSSSGLSSKVEVVKWWNVAL